MAVLFPGTIFITVMLSTLFVVLLDALGFNCKLDVGKCVNEVTRNPFNCFDDLGYFCNKKPFYNPVDVDLKQIRDVPCPQSASFINYNLYTPDRPKLPYKLKLNRGSLNKSHFNDSLPTVMILLGYVANPLFEATDLQTKDAILNNGEYNVFVPQYYPYMFTTLPLAASNTRTVGARIGKLIDFLTSNTNAKPESFHLVGWSFGAHIAGYAGKYFSQLNNGTKIGKITGLDAAGPYFEFFPEQVRLAKGDADFVQAIHTDGGSSLISGWGYGESYGDIDFYVNGGSTQPGCNIIDSKMAKKIIPGFDKVTRVKGVGTVLNETLRFVTVFCHHNRSREYFYESVNDKVCKFLAVQCASYEDFEAGKCTSANSPVKEMGFHAEKDENMTSKASYYLNTNSAPSYCIDHPYYIVNNETETNEI